MNELYIYIRIYTYYEVIRVFCCVYNKLKYISYIYIYIIT